MWHLVVELQGHVTVTKKTQAAKTSCLTVQKTKK